MRIQDRTTEFFAAVNLKQQYGHQRSGHQQYDQQALVSPKSTIGQHTKFTLAALEINNGIRSLLGTLEKLTKRTKNITYLSFCFTSKWLVANSRRIYDDRSAEVAELTFKCKKELSELARKIGDLKTLQGQGQQQQSGPVTAATEDHRNNVVGLLQGQLAGISTKLAQVLETSSSNLKAQRDRREQFGSSLPTGSSSSATQRIARPRSGTSSPQPGGGDSYVAIDMPKMALLEEHNQANLQNRNTALQGIESTINELATIYQQLSHMIAQQGEAVQRIDMNLESMQVNVQRGQEQLMRYLRSVSNNRWLMIKIFAVLIVFSVFFVFIFT